MPSASWSIQAHLGNMIFFIRYHNSAESVRSLKVVFAILTGLRCGKLPKWRWLLYRMLKGSACAPAAACGSMASYSQVSCRHTKHLLQYKTKRKEPHLVFLMHISDLHFPNGILRTKGQRQLYRPTADARQNVAIVIYTVRGINQIIKFNRSTDSLLKDGNTLINYLPSWS